MSSKRWGEVSGVADLIGSLDEADLARVACLVAVRYDGVAVTLRNHLAESVAVCGLDN